jgi:hypothetical protein
MPSTIVSNSASGVSRGQQPLGDPKAVYTAGTVASNKQPDRLTASAASPALAALALALPTHPSPLRYVGEVTYAGKARMSLWSRKSDSGDRTLFYALGPRGNRYLLTDPQTHTPIETKEAAMARARELMQYGAAAFHKIGAPSSAVAPHTPSIPSRPRPLADGSISPLTANWIYENLQAKNQQVFTLWNGPHDYMVRLVMDKFATAVSPASITLKTALSNIKGRTGELCPLNFTVRHESSSLKTSTGTKLQFGYDVSRNGQGKRMEYSGAGDPIIDLISIEAVGDQSLDRLRAELKLERGKSPSTELVVQNALSLGGTIRWRRVWEDPSNSQLSGIDVVLSMKTESAIEVGHGASPGGIDAKAEIEASVRFLGGLATRADVHQLQNMASQAIAQLLIPIPEHPVTIDPLNHGNKQQAVWQLAPDSVSGGKNNGHVALDLAIRVNRLLHQTGVLDQNAWVSSMQQAEKLLARLWLTNPHEKTREYARYLSNPMHINFGIRQLEGENSNLYSDSLESFYIRGQRQLFLGTF